MAEAEGGTCYQTTEDVCSQVMYSVKHAALFLVGDGLGQSGLSVANEQKIFDFFMRVLVDIVSILAAPLQKKNKRLSEG